MILKKFENKYGHQKYRLWMPLEIFFPQSSAHFERFDLCRISKTQVNQRAMPYLSPCPAKEEGHIIKMSFNDSFLLWVWSIVVNVLPLAPVGHNSSFMMGSRWVGIIFGWLACVCTVPKALGDDVSLGWSDSSWICPKWVSQSTNSPGPGILLRTKHTKSLFLQH